MHNAVFAIIYYGVGPVMVAILGLTTNFLGFDSPRLHRAIKLTSKIFFAILNMLLSLYL